MHVYSSEITYLGSIAITLFKSRLLFIVTEAQGMEISRMEESHSTTWHSPTKPTTDGSKNFTPLPVVHFDRENLNLRLPLIRTTCIVIICTCTYIAIYV